MSKKVISEDEIDLVEIARLIWSQKRYIIKVVTLFFLLGVLIAFTSKEEYEASSRLMPESLEGMKPDLGGLGGLAGLAGINLNLSQSGSLTPELYPEIVNSVPFLTTLINAPIYFENIDTTFSSFYYFKEVDRPTLLGYVREYTLDLPGKIKEIFKGNDSFENANYDMIRFSDEDWKILENFSDRLFVSIDEDTGIVYIKAKMPDAVASAMVTSILVEELTKNISKYKLEKVKINLDFIEERFDEAEKDYNIKQNLIARFADRNRNISDPVIQTEYERLRNELDIAFEVYKGLASQLEQAKIKVKEETPIFTVLEPVRIPEKRSSPKRLLTILLVSSIGFAISSIFVFLKDYFGGSQNTN